MSLKNTTHLLFSLNLLCSISIVILIDICLMTSVYHSGNNSVFLIQVTGELSECEL